MIRFLTAAAVCAWLAGTAAWAHAAATDTPATPPSPAHVLAHARVSCGVDAFDVAEQTLVFRASDLSDTALRCVLNAVDAPSYLATDIAHTLKPLETTTARWPAASVSWFRDPESGVVVTIRMTGATQ